MPTGKWDKDCGGQGHRTPYEAVRYIRLCANMYIVTYVYNIMPDVKFDMYNPYTYDNAVINKTTIQHVANIINLFFPEKNYNDIEKELIEDKQLLLKLYKCFPNY